MVKKKPLRPVVYPMFEILSMKEQGKNAKLYSAILVRELTILVEDIFFIS